MPFEQRIARFCAEYPDAPHDLMLASRLLLRSARLLRHHIERALAPHALDMGQYLVMSLLVADGGQPTMPSELGVAIDATRTQMTRLIDGLEARGLVQRKTSTQDRRSLELTLTAEGRALLLLVAADGRDGRGAGRRGRLALAAPGRRRHRRGEEDVRPCLQHHQPRELLGRR